MIETNRELAAERDFLDREIHRVKMLAGGGAAPDQLGLRLAALCRRRLAVCAALANRRIEASNKVVVFARWVSGNGALGGAETAGNRAAMPPGDGWRRQNPR